MDTSYKTRDPVVAGVFDYILVLYIRGRSGTHLEDVSPMAPRIALFDGGRGSRLIRVSFAKNHLNTAGS